jgi:hypothetical protein
LIIFKNQQAGVAARPVLQGCEVCGAKGRCELSVKKYWPQLFPEGLPVSFAQLYLWHFLIQTACRVYVTLMFHG